MTAMGRRWLLPPSTPFDINHAVLTGTLSADPQPSRSPTGEPVMLLRVDFPVADPEHPRMLWTWTSYLVEVPVDRVKGEIEELHVGTPLLAAGRLSDRWMIENGHASRRGVVVATLVKPGAQEAHLELPG